MSNTELYNQIAALDKAARRKRDAAASGSTRKTEQTAAPTLYEQIAALDKSARAKRAEKEKAGAVNNTVQAAFDNPLQNPLGQTTHQQLAAETTLKYSGVNTQALNQSINSAKQSAIAPIRQSAELDTQIKKLDAEIEKGKKEKDRAVRRAVTNSIINGSIGRTGAEYLPDISEKNSARELTELEQQRAALVQQKTALDNNLSYDKIRRNKDEALFEKLYNLDYEEDAARIRPFGADEQVSDYEIRRIIREKDDIKKRLSAKGYDIDKDYAAYKSVINQQKQNERNAAYEVFTRVAPVSSNFAAVATVPARGAVSLMGFLNGERKPNSPYNALNDLSSAVTGETVNIIDSNIKNRYLKATAKTLYKSGVAAAESYITMKTGGKFGELLMSLNAAAQTYSEAVNRGLTPGQAVGTAVAAGVFEALFEHISLERLRALEASPGRDLKTVILNTLKQFVTEGSEEVSTDIANGIYDYLANGGLSEAKVAVQNYINDGMSPEKALKEYAVEFAKGLGESMITGGLSGAMSAGTAQIIGNAARAPSDIYIGKRIKADVESGDINAKDLTRLTGIKTKEKNGKNTVKGNIYSAGVKYTSALENAEKETKAAAESGNEERIARSLENVSGLSAINKTLYRTEEQREKERKISEKKAALQKQHDENIKEINKAALSNEASEKLLKNGFKAVDRDGMVFRVFGFTDTAGELQAVIDKEKGATAALDEIEFSTGYAEEDRSLQEGIKTLSDMINGTGAYADRGKMSLTAANECFSVYETLPDIKATLTDFADMFYIAYGAGLHGLSSNMFKATKTGRLVTDKLGDGYNLTDEELKIAIQSGLRDYVPKPGVTNLTEKGTVDIYSEAPILEAIDAHAKKNGYSVVLVDDAYEEKRMLNGKTDGKVILLSMSQKNTFISVTAWHEVFHYAKMQSKEMKKLLEDETAYLMQYLIKLYGKDEYLVLFNERAPLTVSRATYTETMQGVDVKSLTAENVREELKKAFGAEVFDDIEEEIAAEWYGTAKTVDLERFVKQEVKKNPSLWETIKNKLREIVNDIMTKLTELAKGNQTMASALKFAKENRDVIEGFCNVVEIALGNADNVHESGKGAGTEKYSIALTRTMEFEGQIKQVEDMTLNGSNSIYFGKMQNLTKVGFSDAPFVMNQSDYRKSRRKEGANKHYSSHEVKKSVMLKMKREINDAVIFIDNEKKCTVITSIPMTDTKNNPSLVIAGILKDQMMDGEKINQIKSVYPLDDIVARLTAAGEDNKLIITNKNKAKEIFDSIGVQPAQQSNIFSLAKETLSQNESDVKEKNSFALGSEDTAELEEKTAGNETLEQQLEIVRNMAFAAAKEAAEKTLSVTNGKIAPKQNELLAVAKKALLDENDEKSQKRIARLLRDGINDIYSGARTADTVIRETVDGIRKEAINAGHAEEYDTGGRELKKRMRGVRVYLDEATAGNLVSRYGSMKNVRNKAFGKFFVTTNRETGQDISLLYEELATTEGEGNPYGLPAYESFNGDGAKMFDAILERIGDNGTVFIRTADQMGFTGETLDEWAFQKAGEAIGAALLLTQQKNEKLVTDARKYKTLSEAFAKGISEDAQRARAAAEKKAKTYAENLANSKKEMTSLEYEMAIEKYTSSVMFDELKRKYQERLDKAYRRRMDIRAEEKAKIQIAKKVRRLNDLIEHEQDGKNVPEQLKSSFADFMRMFLSPDVGVFSEERLDRLIRAYDKMLNPMGDESYINNDMYEQYDADIAKNLLDLKAVFDANGDKDWNKVRLDYITNGTAPKKLSETHGFSIQAIKKQMMDEDWAGKREKYLQGNSEEIKKLLEEYKKTRDGYVRISTLGLENLRKVNEILDNVAKIINEANEIRINGRKVKVANIANRAISELEDHKKNRKGPQLHGSVADMLQYKMLTPIYFFNEKLGGAFGELYEDFRNGQDDWFVKIEAAKKKLAEIKDEYKYKEWKNETATIEFSGGWTVTLTADALCQLYATIKREELAGADSEHLLFGGIVLEKKLKDVQKSESEQERKDAVSANAHNFQAEDRELVFKTMDDISENLKKYADAVVKYLSTDVGRWGNEASMELSGIRKFTEEYYFPFQSAENFIYRQAPTSDESKLKHQSFTNRLQYGARSTLIVSSFTEVAASHMQQMALYSSLAVPIDNFNRVYGYKTTPESANNGQRINKSVKSALENAYGEAANRYISQFLKAVNGGLRADETDRLPNKATAVFKKSSVMANASVVIQQPSAIMRATALINPIYFNGSPAFWHYAADYREMMKYCPVAGIKAMGGFDTSTGVSATEWILDEQSIGDRIDNVLGKGAEFADAVAWTNIWNAVKRETRHEHNDVEVGSKQFYDICNKRMRDIVDYTQVYDSTLSKNELMRSKAGLTKMITAFMAEPSLSYNLLTVSGKGKTISKPRALAAFVTSVVLNSALKSIVGAWRDKDEEMTYWEKYISTFLGSLTGSKDVFFLDSEFSVVGLIPWVKDILSKWQGYDVERSDVTVVSDLITAATKFFMELWDEDNKKVVFPSSESMWELAVAVSSLTPVPIKSVYRDITGLVSNVQSAREKAYNTTKLTVRNAIMDEIGFGVEDAKKAYRAVIENDKETMRRMQNPEARKINDYLSKGYSPAQAAENSTIDAVKSFHSLIAQGLAAYDETVYKASDALYSGKPEEYEKLVKELKDKGFTQTDITKAVEMVEKEKLRPQEKEQPTPYAPDKSLYETKDLKDAFYNNNLNSFSYIRKQLIDGGKDEKDINSTMKTEIRELLENGKISEKEAKVKLQNYASMTQGDAQAQLYAWDIQEKYPDTTLDSDNIKKYYAELESQGIDFETYEEYYKATAKLEADVDGDGKTINGSKKKKVLEAINKLPISNAEKDIFYYYAGYKTSTIDEAPWH